MEWALRCRSRVRWEDGRGEREWAGEGREAALPITLSFVSATTAVRPLLRIRRPYYGWWVLVGMVVALIVAEGVTFGAFGAYVEPLEERFGWSRTQVSLGFSVTVGTVGICAPIIGWLIDHVGPRRLMLIGAPLCAVSFTLLAFMTELWQWYAWISLNAIALGCVAYMPAQALAVRWFNRHRAAAVSVIGASLWLGQLAMLPVVQSIISAWGWRDAFLYSGIMVLAAYAVAFLLVRDAPPAGHPELDSPDKTDEADEPQPSVVSVAAGVSAREALRHPLFWCIVVGLMLFFFVLFGWLSQAVPYYRSVDYSVGWSATLVSITAGGAAVWLLAAGSQLERVRRPELAAVFCTALLTLSMLALWLTGGSIGGVAAHIPLYVLGYAAGPPIEALLFSRAFGLRNFATIMGTAFMFETVGIFASPIVAGEIFDNTGSYDYALLLYAGCAGASCVIFLIASRIRQPMAQLRRRAEPAAQAQSVRAD